jgi:glycosyltransferase involved in cell wall biosynthesis
VITLTKDEERNIVGCLESVAWADEIIVIDSGSTDRTVELARQFTNDVILLPWRGYGAARNEGLLRAHSGWILWLDADERVTEGLAAEIRAILAADDQGVAGYEIARRAYFCGKWMRHGGWYPSRVVRLFRRELARFSETRVHERLVIGGRVARTRNDLIHYTDPDLDHYFAKFNSYTSLAARDMFDAGRGFAAGDLVFRPLFQFIKMYLLRLGFLDGVHGFVLCAASSAYVFAKYAKLWDLQQTVKK